MRREKNTGTDMDVIFWTRGGIASALVSLKDLEQIPQLLAAFAVSLKKGEQFKVKI